MSKNDAIYDVAVEIAKIGEKHGLNQKELVTCLLVSVCQQLNNTPEALEDLLESIRIIFRMVNEERPEPEKVTYFKWGKIKRKNNE